MTGVEGEVGVGKARVQEAAAVGGGTGEGGKG